MSAFKGYTMRPRPSAPLVRDWIVCWAWMRNWPQCGHCRKPFSGKNRTARYCSERCQHAGRKHELAGVSRGRPEDRVAPERCEVSGALT